MKTQDARGNLDTRTAIAVLIIGVLAVLALTFAPRSANGDTQTMADRVRFGYMQFNLGYGPAEGAFGHYRSWDIDQDGTADLNWGCSDAGPVRSEERDGSLV